MVWSIFHIGTDHPKWRSYFFQRGGPTTHQPDVFQRIWILNRDELCRNERVGNPGGHTAWMQWMVNDGRWMVHPPALGWGNHFWWMAGVNWSCYVMLFCIVLLFCGGSSTNGELDWSRLWKQKLHCKLQYMMLIPDSNSIITFSIQKPTAASRYCSLVEIPQLWPSTAINRTISWFSSSYLWSGHSWAITATENHHFP